MAWKSERKETTEHGDAMQEFADKIVEQLELGVKPWARPWNPDLCAGPRAPRNAVTGHRYSGINVLVPGMYPAAFQTADPRFATYLQAKEHGWQVRKGERSTPVFFYKPIDVEDEKAEDGHRTIPILKTFSVFHVSQMDGVPTFTPPTVEEAPWTRPEAADIILKNSGAKITVGGDRAFYSPTLDFISLPPDNAFRGPPEFAAIALHELGHWTGHATRLNRDEGMKSKYGSAAYAMEELRAELSSAFIAGELGIPADIPRHASYIQSWLKPLKDSKHEIFRTAADAQKIVNLVLSFHPDFAAKQQAEGQPERPALTGSPLEETAPASTL
jgi:antirestriction protein ArdC